MGFSFWCHTQVHYTSSFVGPLPWASLDPKTDYKLIGEWKRYARFGGREELLRDVPSEFDRILDAIDNIK